MADDKNKKEVAIELSDSEKKIIKNQREIEKNKTECLKEITNILKLRNCTLVVDKYSPIGNPQIIISQA